MPSRIEASNISESSEREEASSLPLRPLSLRELEILFHASQGRSNEEIARELYLSPRTVRNRIGHVFEKLNVSNRTQATAIFIHTLSTLHQQNPDFTLREFRDTLSKTAQAKKDWTLDSALSNLEELIQTGAISREEKLLLTPRQGEILELVARGFSYRQIGEKLHLSSYTVRGYLTSRRKWGDSTNGILYRLNAQSRRQAVLKAINLEILDPTALVQEEESEICEFLLEGCESLTNREIEILEYLIDPSIPFICGEDKQVAYRLNLARKTVRNYITSILRKLGARNATQAAVIFLAYQRRKEVTSPSHERLRPSTSSG